MFWGGVSLFELLKLAQEYGADKDRFEKESSFCILYGLCVRYCAEVKKKNAVGFIDYSKRFFPNRAYVSETRGKVTIEYTN